MKDNRKKSKFISMMGVILLMAMIMATGVGAAPITQTIPLGPNGAETVRSATRSGNYSYVTVKCTAVYPIEDGSYDNYNKMRAQVLFVDRTAMSDQEIIYEGQTATKLELYDGLLTRTNIQFIFKAYNLESARADVTYDPK